MSTPDTGKQGEASAPLAACARLAVLELEGEGEGEDVALLLGALEKDGVGDGKPDVGALLLGLSDGAAVALPLAVVVNVREKEPLVLGDGDGDALSDESESEGESEGETDGIDKLGVGELVAAVDGVAREPLALSVAARGGQPHAAAAA